MKLYLISQEENRDYDTYDSAVVCAANEEIASLIHPSGGELAENGFWKDSGAWCSSTVLVKVEYLGEAAENLEQGVIVALYNAG